MTFEIQKIPFAIRAMLKMLVMRARGIDDYAFKKFKLEPDDCYFLAEILIAGWLNQGFRNAKCFGI
jgi:hypothetical protein